MTLGIAIATPEGIVVAADTLGRHEGLGPEGAFPTVKLVRVGRSVVTFAGLASPGGQLLDERLRNEPVPDDASAREVADAVTQWVGIMVEDHARAQQRNDLATALLVAGYEDDGAGRVYRSRVPNEPVREVLSTAGPPSFPECIGEQRFFNDLKANFVLDVACPTIESAVRLAVRVISLTEGFQLIARQRLDDRSHVEWSVNGPATVARITANGISPFETWGFEQHRID